MIALAYTLIENRRIESIFPIIWVAAALFGSLMRVRVIFFIGPAAALVGAFLLYKIFVYLISLDVKKLSVGHFKVSWIPAVIGLYLVFVFSTNIGAGYVFTSAVGPSFNNNWQESMQWVQDNTAEDTVLMSWWDYGYWFQSGGRRFTMADGGNNNESRNYELANFFTGSNATEWIPFLDEHSVDYIVVDYTLIGKYSAMSKIGSLGYNVESFVGLGRPVRTLSKDGKTIYVYDAFGGVFYIPIGPSGTLDGEIKATFGPNTVYVKNICTPQGLVQISEMEPVMDSCLMFTPFGIFMPYPSMDAGLSNFAKLYFYDGEGIPYVTKVFDNVEIKIFEVANTENEVKNPYPNYLANNPLGVY